MEVGKTYEIYHSRKGKFAIKVISDDGEWLDVEIVSGTAKAMLRGNVAFAGDLLTLRKGHINSFKEITL